MTTQKQSLIAQVIVSVLVGLVSSAGTAYLMVSKFDKRLETHIVENKLTESQLRRDIARIEQANLQQDRQATERDKDIASIKTDIAVIASWVKQQKSK